MTKEQEVVRSVFNAYIRDIKAVSGKDRPTYDMLEEVKNIAIKALEQQPSDDCIKRETVKEFVEYIQSIKDTHNEHGTPINYGTICDIVIRGWKLMDLPPVTPTQCIAEIKFSKDDLREICNGRIEIACEHGTCKDCKQGQKCEHGIYCANLGGTNEEGWYCADFEKRGNENDTKTSNKGI